MLRQKHPPSNACFETTRRESGKKKLAVFVAVYVVDDVYYAAVLACIIRSSLF